jgi:hypothetical protein
MINFYGKIDMFQSLTSRKEFFIKMLGDVCVCMSFCIDGRERERERERERNQSMAMIANEKL